MIEGTDSINLVRAVLAKANRQVSTLTNVSDSTVTKVNSISAGLELDYNTSGELSDSGLINNIKEYALHGVVSGLGVSVTVTPKHITINSGVYYINGVRVEYAGGLVDTSGVSGGKFGTVLLDVNGNAYVLTNTVATLTQLNNMLEIAVFTKSSDTAIDKLSNSYIRIGELVKQLNILYRIEPARYIMDACKVSCDGLYINIASGTVYSRLSNITVAASIHADGYVVYRTNGEYKIGSYGTLVLRNDVYDNGSLVVLGTEKYVVHTIAKCHITGTIYMIIGDSEYTTVDEAVLAEYNLGIFASSSGISVEPLANVVVMQGANEVSAVVDLRADVSNKEYDSIINIKLADLEARVAALEAV